MVKGLEQLATLNRLRELGLFIMEKMNRRWRILWGDLIEAFQYLKGACRKAGGFVLDLKVFCFCIWVFGSFILDFCFGSLLGGIVIGQGF